MAKTDTDKNIIRATTTVDLALAEWLLKKAKEESRTNADMIRVILKRERERERESKCTTTKS